MYQYTSCMDDSHHLRLMRRDDPVVPGSRSSRSHRFSAIASSAKPYARASSSSKRPLYLPREMMLRRTMRVRVDCYPRPAMNKKIAGRCSHPSTLPALCLSASALSLSPAVVWSPRCGVESIRPHLRSTPRLSSLATRVSPLVQYSLGEHTPTLTTTQGQLMGCRAWVDFVFLGVILHQYSRWLCWSGTDSRRWVTILCVSRGTNATTSSVVSEAY